MAQLGFIWRLNTSFKKICNEVDNTRTMMDEKIVNSLVATSNIFQNEKCRYSFPKLFCQIVELNTK
jgi:hypothetical protein